MNVQWAKQTSDNDGVIIGCNKELEWLLPWWWLHYNINNVLPVTFVDFGDLSENAVEWCKQRGNVVKLEIPNNFIANKSDVDEQLGKFWEDVHSPAGKYQSVWEARYGWFNKPFALLSSPYKRTVWMDLDCQTRGPIEPLFELCNHPSGISMAEEPENVRLDHYQKGILLEYEKEYNSGVIVYKHGAPIILEWAQKCIEQNNLFLGDQQLFTRMLLNEKIEIAKLPEIYNCRVNVNLDANAVILHWLGRLKGYLKAQIFLLSDAFFINLKF
jgi:hypothetical protein